MEKGPTKERKRQHGGEGNCQLITNNPVVKLFDSLIHPLRHFANAWLIFI